MSKALQYILLAFTHPNELRSALSFAIWRDPQDIEKMEESGYSRPEMKRCWEFLPLTSRSFAAVIKELEGEMCRVVCLFYLVLRGLDTIEDDMTLDLDLKEQLLLTFHEKLSTPGWTFTGSGPDEADRQLLVEFDNVIAEMMLLEPHYRDVITRICKSMGYGMAHYARAASTSTSSYAIETLKDYDMYCHYVAGLVGEGLSALFSASGKEVPELGRMLTLSNSMGLMLQKTNITRDFREDLDDGRFFWPREIWGKYAEDPKDFYEKAEDPEVQKAALWALSGMVTDALIHAPDCLDYLSLIRNQSFFNFCAIPQVMAIATLEVCFMNPNVFKKNVKIRKTLAVQLIQRATNPREVADIFLTYARRIHKKARPSDPNYVKICIALGQIEQWVENRYPSWVFSGEGKVRSPLPNARDDAVAKTITDARIRQMPSRKEIWLAQRKAQAERAGTAGALADPAATPANLPSYEENDNTTMSWEDKKIMMLFMGSIIGFMFLVIGLVFGLVFYVSNAPEDSFLGRVFNSPSRINLAGESAKVEL